MSKIFDNFDWKNGTLSDLQKSLLDTYAANQVEIYLSGITNEKIAEKHLSNVYKQLGKTAPKFVWLDSPLAFFDQVGAQVRDQVGDQVGAQVGAQVRDQVGDQVGAQVRDQVRAQVGDQVRALLRSWDWGGNMSFYKFFNDEFEKNALEDWCLYAEQVTGGVLRDDVAYLVRKPIRIVRNNGVLHYDHDKAIEWADGNGYYFLHGVAFEKDMWQKIVDEKFTLKDLAKGDIGADQRGAAIQMLRADRLLEQVNAKLINIGKRGVELYQVDEFTHHVLGESKRGDTEYCMKLEHPSIEGKYYIEWVDPKIAEKNDADEAMAFSRGITKQQYLSAEIA